MLFENLEEISKFLDEAGMFFLATVDGDQPKNRPLAGHYIIDNKLFFVTGEHKNVYKQLIKNPKLEIVAFSNGVWLRYSGRAVFETDSKYCNLVLKNNVFLQNIYNEKTGNKMAIFYLENESAKIMDGSGKVVNKFV